MLTLCVSCLSGCNDKDVVAIPFEQGQTFLEITGQEGAPCDGYFIDVKSAQRLAMELLIDKTADEIK